ncbi:ABC transporter permease [Cohnella silvisoli]|uniref:Iron ABC transporter permease n=1 Tax=Cohnella silvisoli TaxID=2873699 RepID=A0ABV1KPU0_9BACL|nr:iron ABC transporter permease [Cohnella silvisoli]MCD9021055.1 iron ABC transporter permease [Cohnella silvisoli]
MRLVKVLRGIRQYANGWLYASLLGAAAILLPLIILFISLFQPPNENWLQIKQFLLRDYVIQSIWLVLFSSLFTMLLGVTLAWLVAAFDFPFKRFFSFALALPLAVPPYIAAYTYSTMTSYTGFVQTTLRNEFGWTPDPKWFGIMSMRGAIFIFTLFLFPYVYLIAKSFLERQSGSYIENARLLGRRPAAVFFRIVLPISRPAIVGGVMLVVFEVLSDYGVSSYYGIQSVSVAIFQTWFGMYDVDSAVRLAAWLMTGVIGLFVFERMLRHRRNYAASTSKTRQLAPMKLRGIRAAAACLFCGFFFSISFLIPVLQLIVWATWSYRDVLTPAFYTLTFNTVRVGFTATFFILLLSIITANVNRMKGTFAYVLARSVTAGYSVPGTIIAIGVLSLFIGLDRLLAPIYAMLGRGQAPLVLSMSIVMLIAAYVVRFMATGYNAIEAGYEKIGMKYTEASRLLGLGMTRTFFKAELPLIKGSLLSAIILTFVEIMKELPLALLLRPFNFETLATKTYQYASDERIYEASVPALFIISVSMISVILFHQIGKKLEL